MTLDTKDVSRISETKGFRDDNAVSDGMKGGLFQEHLLINTLERL